MRAVTVVALVLVVAAFGGAAGVAITGGFGDATPDGSEDPGTLSVTWTSDTQVASDSNHHEVGVGTHDGAPRAFVPLSSTKRVDACAFVALDGDDRDELFVIDADGTVSRLDYET